MWEDAFVLLWHLRVRIRGELNENLKQWRNEIIYSVYITKFCRLVALNLSWMSMARLAHIPQLKWENIGHRYVNVISALLLFQPKKLVYMLEFSTLAYLNNRQWLNKANIKRTNSDSIANWNRSVGLRWQKCVINRRIFAWSNSPRDIIAQITIRKSWNYRITVWFSAYP